MKPVMVVISYIHVYIKKFSHKICRYLCAQKISHA